MRRIVLACLAAGLVGMAAPIPAAYAEPAFGGYSTEATATPLKFEIYEPVIPIPATPQAELDSAYTHVEAASGPTGHGVASWMWPGDPVGQGCKTFVEQLGLGATGLCKDGYPVQVNSETPGGPSKDSDEQVPGSLMRTSANRKGVEATAGWSSNSDVSDNQQKSGQSPVPGAPGNPTDQLGSLGAAITGKHSARSAQDPPSGGLPPELAALVDVDGVVSSSRTETVGNTVTSIATSKLHNVSILGGVITADSITVSTTTTADGKQPTASGVSDVTGLELAGAPLTVGRDGVRLADKKASIPGLPDNPNKALAQLGVSLVLPKPDRSVQGDTSASSFQGLQIVIDTRPLRSHLDAIPFDQIVGLIPDQAGKLKSLIGAATQLAPEFVITAGNAAAQASTVPKMQFDLPSVNPGSLNGAAAPPSTGAGGGVGGSAAAAPGLGGPAAAAGGGDVGALAAKPMSAGLPPLGSIPGALTAGGIIMAAGIGWWLQKIGGLVLGGAGACSHGLETGVPDLRKA